MRLTPRIIVSAVLLAHPVDARCADRIQYPGPAPGPAAMAVSGNVITARNHVLSAQWHWSSTGIGPVKVAAQQRGQQKHKHKTLCPAGELFQIVLADGTTYLASELRLVDVPRITARPVRPASSRWAGRLPGQCVEIPFRSGDGRLCVVWRAVFLDGANYVRQEIEVRVQKEALTIREIVWLNERIAGAANSGSVDGSLVVSGPFFLGCEDPMAENRAAFSEREIGSWSPEDFKAGRRQRKKWLLDGVSVCRMRRNARLAQGEVLTQSFVVGVAPEGQLRRAFLYYLERERAHPYRPFLHYNSWYDIAWKPFALNETNCLEAIRLFGERFIKKHGVTLDAMVFDDGWDDPRSLWRFHDGFPHGFTPLAAACREVDTRLGVWLSPFGGYGEPRKQRLKYGREQGYETNAVGFSMAGPKYYAAFKRSCIEMIQKYGVNHFKFDGIAKGMRAQGGGEYILDTEAMRRLMLELRREDPNLYINLTTGSWPSPFWLRYADSLWRQGRDMGFAGPGTKQQQWLTYRDQETYRNIVLRGPLYPLNSLMTQGVAYSRQGHAGDPTFTSAGFKDDVRAFFGSGTSLQELYIQPGRLTDDDWSVLAEAAKWSRSNADVLVDTHWIGGDPSKGHIYGFASWSPRKGIVMLRNPDARQQTFRLDVGRAFELPASSPTTYRLTSPWKEDASAPARTAVAGKPAAIDLEPFQVLVLDAVPIK